MVNNKFKMVKKVNKSLMIMKLIETVQIDATYVCFNLKFFLRLAIIRIHI